jgi:hypothetical protein
MLKPSRWLCHINSFSLVDIVVYRYPNSKSAAEIKDTKMLRNVLLESGPVDNAANALPMLDRPMAETKSSWIKLV